MSAGHPSHVGAQEFQRREGVLVMGYMSKAYAVVVVDLHRADLGGPFGRWPGRPNERGEIELGVEQARHVARALGAFESLIATAGVAVELVESEGPLRTAYLRVTGGANEGDVLHVGPRRAGIVARGLEAFIAAATGPAQAQPPVMERAVVEFVMGDTRHMLTMTEALNVQIRLQEAIDVARRDHATTPSREDDQA